MITHEVVVGVFTHAELKSSIYFGLALLLHRVLATFWSKHVTFMPVFRKTPSFLVKLGSQILQTIRFDIDNRT